MAVINVTPLMDITALINSASVNEGDVLLLEEGIYFQSVAVTKNNIRIIAKGPGVIFDGRSTLIDAFILVDVSGVVIEGINMRHYRGNGILMEFGIGNRIVKNKISNMIENGIELVNSNSNLIWKNEITSCYDGILLINGSTHNWIVENVTKECYGDGYEAFFGPDSNNAFLANTAIGNRNNGMEIYGSNNLILDNLLIDNGQGVIISSGSNTAYIDNTVEGTKLGTHQIFNGYNNFFASENYIFCNRREGMENLGQLGVFLNNEILYNGDTGILLDTTSSGNLVMDNVLICNIPQNIEDRGINNVIIRNIERPCETCEAPSEICNDFPEKVNSMDKPREGVN
ncbi:MAG: hypothetical protein GX077_01810 [Tissierellia bacterium]|nr:hypothetical protein [Erysipelotrichaceae bacterium]NLY85073.1 hypothetical protein [Tissierellia bacterium]